MLHHVALQSLVAFEITSLVGLQVVVYRLREMLEIWDVGWSFPRQVVNAILDWIVREFRAVACASGWNLLAFANIPHRSLFKFLADSLCALGCTSSADVQLPTLVGFVPTDAKFRVLLKNIFVTVIE